MLNQYFPASLVTQDWHPVFTRILMAALALGAGLLMATLPLQLAVIMLLGMILVTLTLIQPLAGLAAALVVGLTKPYTDAYYPSLPLDLGQIAILLTLGSWLLHFIRKRQITAPLTPLNVPLLGFIGAASLSFLNVISLDYAINEMIKWLQLILVMWLVIDLAGTRNWRIVAGMVLIAAAIQALLGVYQFGLRGEGPDHYAILGRFYRAYGSFEQPNPYGGFLGLILSFSLGLSLGALEEWIKSVWAAQRAEHKFMFINRSLWPLLALAGISALLLVALVMSWSRGAWLGFGAAALVVLFTWPRKLWIGATLALTAVGGALFAYETGLLPEALAQRLTDFTQFVGAFDVRGAEISAENYSVLERLAHWQAALEMAHYHPWIGVGLGNYEPAYPIYRLLNWPHPLGHAHNIYLNMLSEIGIIGVTSYLGMWAAIFWQTWRATRMQRVWERSAAVGMMGAWTHLSVHHVLDNLYVANIHLHIGVLLGLLSVFLMIQYKELHTIEREE